MNIKDLEYFTEISKAGSITKASKNAFISPQGLSSALQKMEKELGTELFERSPNGVKPNEYGKVLLEKSETILQIYEELQNEIRDLKQQSQGFIRLVSAYGVLRLLTPDLIFDFMNENKGVNIDYLEFPDKYVDEMIENEKADIGLAIGPINEEKFDAVLIYSEDLMLLVRDDHELATMEKVSFKHIKGFDFIIESSMFKMHTQFVNKCKQYDFEPNILFNTSGYSLCHKLCAQGRGASITLKSNFKDMNNEGLCVIPFDEAYKWNVYLIMKKDKMISQNLDFFKQHVINWKI